jgi:hypothetical protein
MKALSFQEGNMSRTEIKVNQPTLIKVISDLESGKVFNKLSALWDEAAAVYNKTDGIPAKLTASVVRSRVLEWKLPIKTQPGKRGRPPGMSNGTDDTPSEPSKVFTVTLGKVRILRPDRYNVLIEEQNGDGKWRHHGYFTSFASALGKASELLLPDVPVEVSELISVVKANQEMMLKAILDVKLEERSIETSQDPSAEDDEPSDEAVELVPDTLVASPGEVLSVGEVSPGTKVSISSGATVTMEASGTTG